MQLELEDGRLTRRSLRRAVRVETDVVSDLWDGAVPFLATNLSEDGLWLDSELELDPGAELLVSLRPPRWQGRSELHALAQVARVGMFRRKDDPFRPGMGLRFIDMDRPDAVALRAALRGLPPPLPHRARAASIEQPRPCVETGGGTELVLLHDGARYALRAESGLLTGGRGKVVVAPSGPVRPSVTLLPRSSPMTAIFALRAPLRAAS